MHSKDTTKRNAGSVNHPAEGEWMSFLYGELPPKRKDELQTHLSGCPSCSAQVRTWRASMRALDDWTLPWARRAPLEFGPILKWAAAAALILAIGFLLGRHGSTSAREIAELKTSVAQLTELVQNQSATSLSNSVAASATVANTETLRLLADYSRLQDEQRAANHESINLALHAVNARLNRFNDDLERVVVGAENGFQETHDNLARVASLSLTAKN